MPGPSPRTTGTKSVDLPWRSLVVSLDPDFEAVKRNEPEYEMSSGRVFSANRSKRWPYDQDS